MIKSQKKRDHSWHHIVFFKKGLWFFYLFQFWSPHFQFLTNNKIIISFVKLSTVLISRCFIESKITIVAPDIAAALKILVNYGKRIDSWHLVLLGEKVLSKESPPSITVIRNPNWSWEILWLGIGYIKGKILSPLKRSAWGRLHCWFCLKLLNVY